MNKSTKPFACRYYHDGAWWALTVHAYNEADARRRADKLGGLQIRGELVATIPARIGWLAKTAAWIHNKLT